MAEKKNPKKKKETSVKEFFADDVPMKERSMSARVINVILWFVLFVWMGLCIVDYFRARQETYPIFTFNKKTIPYSDGQVVRFTGLGYRVYYYERDSYKGVDFGPFWSKDQSANQKTK